MTFLILHEIIYQFIKNSFMQMDASTDIKTKKELKIGIALSYLLIGLNVISGFLLIPFIIKNVGQSNFGIYSAASSLAAMFVMDLGLGTAVTRFVSKYRVTSSQDEIDKIISVIFICFLVLSGILAIIFTCIYPFLGRIYSSFTFEELESLKIVYIIIAIYSVATFPFSIVNGILIAYDKIFYSKIADIISKVIFIAITILVLTLNMGLYMLTACYAIHGIVCTVLKFIFVKIKTPISLIKKVDKDEFKNSFKDVLKFSLWAAINSYGKVFLISFVPSILGFTSSSAFGTKEIAVFSVATQIESYVCLFATTFGSIFYPSISRILFFNDLDYSNNLERFKEFHIKIARIQITILTLIIVGLFVCGNEFLQLWVGAGYEESYYCILLICTPALFFYPLQTAENAMAAIDKIKYCAFSTIVSVVIGVSFSALFASFFGAIGAALGLFIGFSIRTILFYVCFEKSLSIKSFSFILKAYISFLIPALISALIGCILNIFFPGPSWLIFIIKVIIISFAYIVSTCLIGLNIDEKNRIDHEVKKVYLKILIFMEKIER